MRERLGSRMYKRFFKRLLDILLSGIALLILSPILLILIVLGAIFMGGNPFYFQSRPGRNEKIFKIIKFRTMDNRRDENGKLLPDDVRINAYGRFLRKTSLDELPEMINIFKGDMSLVGPRPLLIEYLPWYTEEEKLRHSVRPGLTGLAQVNGRNFVGWDNRLAYDVEYVKNLSLMMDLKVIFRTVAVVFERKDIAVCTNQVEPNFAEERKSRVNVYN